MSDRVIPVESYRIAFERIHGEDAALEAWRQFVLANGWSRVGEPTLYRFDDPKNGVGMNFVEGRLIQTDQPLRINPEFEGYALRVPNA